MPNIGKISHENSQKLRSEIKNVIDRMVLDGIAVTKAEVMRQAGSKKGITNSKEISDYIAAAQEKQKNEKLRVDIKTQNSVLYKKLMASYIFEYALIEEQEAFLLDAIERIKNDNTIADKSIKFLAAILKEEANEQKIQSLVESFNNILGSDIPDWQEKLMSFLDKDSIAAKMLKQSDSTNS